MGRMDGKVALISGGARGMGEASARLLAKEGAKVVFGDLRDDQGTDLERDIRDAGGEATYVHLDVTKEEDWRKAVETAIGKYGKLNVLINNAGIGLFNLIENTTEEEWDLAFAVHSKGTFFGTKHSIPEMRKAGGGSIINITSIAAQVASPTGGAAYAASKGAVRILTKNTAIHHAKENIRCNSIYPGMIFTPMMEEGLATGKGANAEERKKRIPLGRWGTPEDIANAVLYLASDESSFVTGVELGVDGGGVGP